MGPPSEKGGIHQLARGLDDTLPASMGPPSEKGGIVIDVWIDEGDGDKLQWGRPPRRAESRPGWQRIWIWTGFNGAALREGRNPQVGCGTSQCPSSFNGAALREGRNHR